MKKKNLESPTPVQLKQVTIRRDEFVVLKDVDLTLERKEFAYLVGPVGSGKSSLLEVLYGELKPHGGEAHVLGYDLHKMNISRRQSLRRNMGIVFQSSNQLLYNKTVEENLDFVLRSVSLFKKEERKERIRKALETVGIQGKGYRYPHELSGGEAARVCIARSLIVEPQFIILDEPTTGLDNETALNIAQLLYTIAQEGPTVLFATHNTYIWQQLPATMYIVDPETCTLKKKECPEPSSSTPSII